jgi:hypothetical protein
MFSSIITPTNNTQNKPRVNQLPKAYSSENLQTVKKVSGINRLEIRNAHIVK